MRLKGKDMRVLIVDELAAPAFVEPPAENEPPKGAMRVQPYTPNRKQRRAQAANRRKKETYR